jgi:hypothetical protein
MSAQRYVPIKHSHYCGRSSRTSCVTVSSWLHVHPLVSRGPSLRRDDMNIKSWRHNWTWLMMSLAVNRYDARKWLMCRPCLGCNSTCGQCAVKCRQLSGAVLRRWCLTTLYQLTLQYRIFLEFPMFILRSVAGLSPRRPKFDSRSIHVRFVVDKLALRQVFLHYRCFPCQYNATNAPYARILLSPTLHKLDWKRHYTSHFDACWSSPACTRIKHERYLRSLFQLHG